MKMMRLSLAVCALAFLLAVASCKKDKTTDTSCGTALICSTVDGVGYTSTPYSVTTSGFFGTNTSYNGAYAQLNASSTSTGGYYTTVFANNGTATNGATWQIDFTITQLPVSGGTYTTQAGSASFDYYAGSTSNQQHYVTDSAHTGTVTISSIDTVNNTISGTFSYTATEAPGQSYTPTTHTITSGSFTKVLLKH